MTSGGTEPIPGPAPPPLSGQARTARTWVAATLGISFALLAAAAWLLARAHASGSDRELAVAIGLGGILLVGASWRTWSAVRARDRYEATLSEARDEFRTFFDESPIGKSMTDPAGRLRRVNRAFCAMLGYSADELASIDFAAITHPDDVSRSRDAHRSLLDGERSSWTTDKRYVRKDGSIVWAEVTTSLRRDGRGRPACFLTHVQDVSERKRAEETLRESEERFRTAFQLIPDAVGFSRLEDGRYVFVNSAFTRLTGYEPEAALGRTSIELNIWESPDDRKKLVEELASRASVEDFETRIRHTDGSIRTVLTSGTVFELAGVPHLLNIVRDVTERRRLEAEAEAVRGERLRLLEEADRSRRALLSLVEDQGKTEAELRRSEAKYRQLSEELERRVLERTAELETSNRELEAFSYSVSHDLRAPLRAIEGFSALVVEQCGSQVDSEAQRLLGVVRTNARRMARLIDDLLLFSRTGRSEIRRKRLDMEAMARSAFEEVVTDPEARARIGLRVGKLPEVDGDAALLRQVWINLLSNAVKFSSVREKPLVEVEGARDGDSAVYRVKDNGAGFDMAYVAKLFGVFQRLHGMNEFEGTGVGLALVKRIVTRHGGRIWAEGAIGQGATLSFSLPCPGRGPADA